MLKITKYATDGAKATEKCKNKTSDNVHLADWAVTCKKNKTTQLVVSYKEGKKVSKLREPRNLYDIRHNYSNINTPRWPVEMKVLPQNPYHVEYHPPIPELFNSEKDSESEFDTLVLHEVEDGILVYDNSIVQNKCFERARPGGTTVRAKARQAKMNIDFDGDVNLQFESRFESGNLSKAVKIGPNDYQLWLRTDLYTEKYTQWYYFQISNALPGVNYRFTIMNLMKSSSLYGQGMRPLFYSETEARENGKGWHRIGENIKYYKNDLTREENGAEKRLYSLSWTVQFQHSDDRCYFAHCYPYTYTDLQEYLRKFVHDKYRAQYCKQRVLTRTLAGNFVYVLTITNPSKCPGDAKQKRAVVLSARVHPGETNSSWMMKGLLDYLTSDKQDAKLLRDTFVFKVIPMLNPDGVIVGNYRCSLSGRDLNRNYKTELRDAFPPVWFTREMIKRVRHERDVVLYCDFHGHSRQQNVFIYGCEDRKNIANGFKERVFPMMLSKNCQDKFCFKRCKFKVQKSKSGTGRVVMWNLGIRNSYTLEATFCGSTLGEKTGQHFTTKDYELMGYHLCDTLLDYCDPDMSKYLLVLRELELLVKNMILCRLRETGLVTDNMDTSDIDLDRDYVSESSTDGSDSSVSDGPPMQLMYSERNMKGKKKRLKSRRERNKKRAEYTVKACEQTNGKIIKNSSSEDKFKNDIGKQNTSPPLPSSNPKSPCLPPPWQALSPPPQPPQKRSLAKKVPSEKKVTIVRQVNYTKVRHYLDSMRLTTSPSKGSGLPNVISPRLPYGSDTCLGLAPANGFTVSRDSSLKRWTPVRHYSPVAGEVDDEGSFIGRYLAKHVTNVSGTNLPEIGKRRPNENRDEDCPEPATDQLEAAGSHEKYCPYHTALLRRKTVQKSPAGKATESETAEKSGGIPHQKSDSNLPMLCANTSDIHVDNKRV